MIRISSYVIELTRWGITQGLPTKRNEIINGVTVNCYANSDYTMAYNNIIGFNKAMSWAYANGYRRVVVPNGKYAICYSNISDNDKENNIVIDYSNFILDLNGSTFKVIYDSNKRSPYDWTKTGSTWAVSTTPPYKFGGRALIVRDCNFTEVINGTLIGDKIDRDFLVQDEKAVEWTYGICAGGNCRYINIENFDVSFFMGDGMTISNGKLNTQIKVGYQMGWKVGELDANGLPITSSSKCVSDFISVNATTPHFLQGYGYTQGMTKLMNKKFSVYFYDINKKYITKETSFVLREFTTTKSTQYIRLVVEESSVDVDGWQMVLRSGIYGSYLTFQNNYIHHNHRGGMTPGVNDMFILNNHFYNNGEAPDYENGLPGFEQSSGVPSSTRYHINMEDSQGFNTFIIGNKFENGRLGIAARGYNYVIKNNWFKDTGILLYRLHYAVIKDNYFDNGSFDTFPYDSAYTSLADYVRHWHIEGNNIDGSFNISGTAIVDSIVNNRITGRVTITPNVKIFKNNRFAIDTNADFNELVSLSSITNIDGCTFIKSDQSTVKNSISLTNTLLTNCIFKNVKIRCSNVTLKDSSITSSGFEVKGNIRLDNCTITHDTYMLQNNYPNNPENSAFINVINSSNVINVEFVNSILTSTSSQSIFASPNNALVNANLRLENTKIIKKQNNKLGIGIFNGTLQFINSTISSDVVVPNITPNMSLNHRFTDCTFNNVSFTVKTTDVQYTQQDLGILTKPLSGNGAPQIVPLKIGQEYYDLTNKKLYKAFGTTVISDWILV